MPNLSHSPDTFEQFRGLIQAHHEMIEQMKGVVVSKVPIDPGAFLDEFISQPSSPLVWTPAIDRPALVTNILLSYTPVAAATLSIGQNAGTLRNIPIPLSTATFPISIACAMVIKPGDAFTLTCANATSMYLEIMGKILSGTDWSQV